MKQKFHTICLTLFLILTVSLNVKAQKSDTENRFYQWEHGLKGQVNQYKSKPYAGYVILKDGTRIEGELKVVIREEERFMKLLLETNGNKMKLFGDQISNYGLYVDWERAKRNRKKPFKEEGLNLHKGTVTLLDGTKKSGWVAFSEARGFRYDDGIIYYYTDVIFLKEIDGLVEYFPNSEIEQATKEINGKTKTFDYLENSLVDLDRLVELRPFYPGKIQLQDSSWVEGKISRFWGSHLYVRSIFFKTMSEKVKSYRPPFIQRMVLNSEGEDQAYVLNQGVLVEVIQESNSYLLTRNPFSTSSNMFVNLMGGFAATIAQGVASNAAATKIASTVDADTEEFKKLLDEATTGELIQMEESLAMAERALDETMLNKETKKKLQTQRLALRVAAETRPTHIADTGMQIMRREWSLINTKTGEEISFLKGSIKKSIEPKMYGCGKYVLLPKQEQRQLFDWDNLDKLMAMLESCE